VIIAHTREETVIGDKGMVMSTKERMIEMTVGVEMRDEERGVLAVIEIKGREVKVPEGEGTGVRTGTGIGVRIEGTTVNRPVEVGTKVGIGGEKVVILQDTNRGGVGIKILEGEVGKGRGKEVEIEMIGGSLDLVIGRNMIEMTGIREERLMKGGKRVSRIAAAAVVVAAVMRVAVTVNKVLLIFYKFYFNLYFV
jgi:hypothetical protein